jgi:hypothetical protein
VLVAVSILAGCTGQPQPAPTAAPSPVPVACSLGEVRFAPVKHGYLLTAASPVTDIAAPGGGPINTRKEQVRSRRVEVLAGPEVPHEYVYQQLSDLIGEDTLLADYGSEYQFDGAAESGTVLGPGRFVAFDALRTVDVTFAYECGGVTSHGSVRSWRRGGFGGLVDCEVPVDDETAEEQAMLQEVVDLRC